MRIIGSNTLEVFVTNGGEVAIGMQDSMSQEMVHVYINPRDVPTLVKMLRKCKRDALQAIKQAQEAELQEAE